MWTSLHARGLASISLPCSPILLQNKNEKEVVAYALVGVFRLGSIEKRPHVHVIDGVVGVGYFFLIFGVPKFDNCRVGGCARYVGLLLHGIVGVELKIRLFCFI